MQKRRFAFVILAVLGALGGAFVVAVGEAVGDRRADPPRSTFSVDRAREFREFEVYNAGASVEGLDLVAVLRHHGGDTNYVSFIYGDCVASGEMGCAPPAEVQVWPACIRNIALYEGPMAPEYSRSEIRGAPAFVFEDGRRLEIQTVEATVVVFGRTADVARGVAMRLRGVNHGVRPLDRLPDPAAGALEGTLGCR